MFLNSSDVNLNHEAKNGLSTVSVNQEVSSLFHTSCGHKAASVLLHFDAVC